MRSMISRGLRARSVSGPRPQDSIAPGRKFSISTSASLASRLTMSCASGVRKSRARLRLFRDCTCHQTEVPSLSIRQTRSGSPAPGGSILITSAPKSARVLAANGPAISWPSSMTFRPDKADAGIGGAFAAGPPCADRCSGGVSGFIVRQCRPDAMISSIGRHQVALHSPVACLHRTP
jgi:hypothetical protein